MFQAPTLTRTQKIDQVRAKIACQDSPPSDSYRSSRTPSLVLYQGEAMRRRQRPDWVEAVRAKVRRELDRDC